MALYREGKAAMAADGTVTGTGTKWQSSLLLIRPGATIMFLSSPIQMAVVNKVVSDTEIKAITTKGAVVASSDYAILLSDSLTVDGLAQDVAETLRYYQSQETVIADAVEFFKTFDFESLQNLANQIKADSESAESSAAAAAASENAAKTSETNAKASENAAKTSEVAAETARDRVQQIINDAGEQSTLVVLASGSEGKGDSLLAVKQPFPGSVLRTQHDKNAEFVSITDFSGALSGRENDSTSAFVAAYATGLPVYVPYGDWFTSDYRSEKLFGPGVIYSDDSYFTDSGERPQHGAIQTGKPINEHSETWGNRERAVGRSLIVNNPNGRVQVSGFSNPSQYAAYINSDHVGYYIGMYGPKNQTLTTAASTTYTSDSLTAPEIVESNDIRLGMFVKTKHSTPYKGKIIGVDYDSNTITVDGWYAQGDTSSGQVPDSGKAALINAADKMWGQNTVVFLEPDSTAVTATGYELGFQLDTAPGNPVWGYHAVNYSDTYYLNNAFRATGRWNIAFYATSQALVGLQHDVGEGNQTAVLVSNLTDQNWTGSAVNLNTNFRKATSNLVQIRSGGVTHFSIDSRGVRNVQRESVAVVSSGTTITGLSPSIILFNSTTDIIITLSASNAVAGQLFEFRNVGSGTVKINNSTTLTNGQYAKFVFDGNSYILLIKV